ncbi:ABC transporter permease [Bacillus sp. Bva_UNVM-123]|uniref:ABC transporter permease n=1 Tax=Bacillus sp. Bva_UNVM-123 TaxID=2829798 RepID=UPI00391EFE19
MGAFLYGVSLQWKLDIRNKGVLLTYYVVPLVFFGFMGSIFTSIDPTAYKTLIQSMTVFGVTMGAVLGSPIPLVELYGSEMKKLYKVGGIPLWTSTVNNIISGFIHLMIMSLFIFFIAPIAFNASTPNNLLTFFISLIIFIIASLSIGTIIGLLVKSTAKLTMIVQFIFLPSIMLSSIMFSSDMLPTVLQHIGKIFPATWGYVSMNTEELEFMPIAPLLLIIAGAILVSIFRLRTIRKE